MKKLTLILFIAVFGLSPIFGQQLKSFTADSAVYIDEIRKFTDNYINDESSKVLDSFIDYWNSPKCTPQDREEIILFSNLLLKKNGRPSPHFIDFYKAVLKFAEGNFEKLDIPAWKQSFRFYLESKTTPLKVIENYQDVTLNLLESNILYNNSSTIWSVPQTNYVFRFNQGSPDIRFDNVDLNCNAKRDSISIENTSGTLNPVDMTWNGNKGTVTWERAGFAKDEVYAEISKYRIPLQKTEYKVDSVLFYYKKYFDYPLEGRLEEKVMQITKPENSTYPKFYSYRNKYILPDLFKDIEFTGGLSMQGSKLTGMGTTNEPAVLDIFDNDTLRMRLKSSQVLILANGMRSGSASMTLYIDKDSIYHPDLQLNYNETTDEFRFLKSDVYTSQGPYHNSYHKVDMNFDEFLWKRRDRAILFKPVTGSTMGQATFESNSFFNYDFYEKLQGLDDTNPLVNMWEYSKGTGLDRYKASEYADYLVIDPSVIRQQLMKFTRLGFIYWDELSDMVTLNPKLFYFLDASIGNTDYDVIYFTSKTQAPQENASLNLSNYDLIINGIQNIFLSDSQNVVLIPDNNQIIMKRNRNFQFNGSINAGLFTYYGNNFFFDYDRFSLNLQYIDSLSLQARTGKTDNFGIEITQGVNNLIEQVTGELLIDDPGNKSGIKNYPQYPVFTSRENSYVYFDEPQIQHGVYKRKNFYFQVYPFTIDSLDNFTTNGMQLAGKFESGGIIPTIKDSLVLTVRNDYSLGFYITTPKQGLPAYDGKGTLTSDIELSNHGLHAYGRLDYLTSTTYSDDFLLHPDSLMGISRDFIVQKSGSPAEYPKVRSSNNEIKWLTKQDEFLALKRDVDFTMFSDSVRLNGDLNLKPSGLTGKGRMNLVDATIGSDKFKFRSEAILADSADFRVAGSGIDVPAMNTDNVNVNIDFISRKGNVKSNTDYSLVEFQDNRYISKLDFFNWDMMKKEIELGLSKKIGSVVSDDSLTGARYISVHPEQDSLSFVSNKTVFDYKHQLINAQSVPYIQVADARIFPKDGKLTVEKNARIRRLSKAEILADFTNRYYSLYNANVEIYTRKDYAASADYDYVDLNKKPWKINFREIRVDSTIQTIGKGVLTILDSFKLSPYFEFQGDVRLAARRPNLTFDGASRLIHQCKPGRSWLKFEAEIDPDSVLIPVSEEPVDINLKRIYAGTMITRDSTHIYSTYLSGRKDYFDDYLTHASGFLRYDRVNENYEIAPADKLADRSKPGNYLTLDTDSCYEYSEGNLNFDVDYGQIKIKTAGKAVHDIDKDTYKANVMMSVDFFFSAAALEIFGKELDSLVTLKAFDLTNPDYRQSLRDFIGLDAAVKMENELGLYGNYKNVPENFNKNLILSNIKLEWNQRTRSFRYHGPVGIIRVGNKAVNKEVEAYVELSKRGSGDLLDIYFILDNNTFYYFGYNPGSFQVTSSNKNYNSLVFNLKDTDRRLKVAPGSTGYIYALAPDRRVELFLKRYNEAERQDDGEDGLPNNGEKVQ
jgi:hypothetical protein